MYVVGVCFQDANAAVLLDESAWVKPLQGNCLGIKTMRHYPTGQYVNRSSKNVRLATVNTLVNKSARFFSVPCLAIRIVFAATASRHR